MPSGDRVRNRIAVGVVVLGVVLASVAVLVTVGTGYGTGETSSSIGAAADEPGRSTDADLPGRSGTDRSSRATGDTGASTADPAVAGGSAPGSVVPPVVRLRLDWPGKSSGQQYVLPGDPVTLDASESYDPDGEISTYAFDVDFDGNYEIVESTEPVHEVRYDSEGYRSVVVRVTDEEGDTNTTSRQVFVNAPPTARFDYSPSSPTAGDPVIFDGTGSSDYNGTISSYEWRVQGVEVGTGPTLNYTFDSPGSYEVTLVVEDDEDGGPANRTTRLVTVEEPNQPPEARFTISPRPAVAGEPTTLDASNSTDPDGTVERYLWDFDGDGTVDENTTDPVTTHRFETPRESGGFVNVGLRVVDDTGNEGRTTRDLEVLPPPPEARCELQPAVVAPGETAILNASGSENASSYRFDVDTDPELDTDLYADPTFEVSFQEPGNYTLGVRAFGDDPDRFDDADCTLRVSEPPQAAFSVAPRPAVAGEETTLDASGSTDPDGEVVRYLWDFDDDGTVDENTTDPVTTHRFEYPASTGGFTNVRLTVVDDVGLEDVAGADLEVRRPELEAACTADPRTVTPGEPVTLSVDPGPDVTSYQYDRDSRGEFGPFTDEPTATVEYDSVGGYAPRVKVWNDSTERSRVVPCGDVTVEEPNAPPDAVFTSRPSTPETGQEVTVDASGATDPDGQVVRYEWDFDGDGNYETTNTRPTVTETTTFSQPGEYTVGLRVVDDDGESDVTERTITVLAPLQAECTVSPREVVVGDSVSIGVEGGDNLDSFQFDGGDGSFGDFRDSASTTLSYDAPGNYTPRVKVWAYPSERSLVVECPPVRVRENAPPTATFVASPSEPNPNDSVTFDASNSTDPDGQVVRYEWDFDDDGTVDATSADPTVTHAYPSAGNRTVRLVVYDDRNASAVAVGRIPVVEPSGPFPDLPFPWWVIPLVLVGGGAAGWGLRKFPKHVPEGSDTGREYAMGTFETPTGSETLTVGGVGFEPDVVLLRASNQVRAPASDSGADGESGDETAADGKTGRSTGLSIGSVVRKGGTLEQNVVSVADDAESVDSAVGATHSGKAIDVLVHGDDRVGSLAGSVRKFTDDGFEVEFDASKLPADQDRGYVVHYQAFALDNVGDVDVGHFSTATGTGTQTVDLDVDADYVSLTASSLPDELNSAATGSAVGICHGEAVSVPARDDTEPGTGGEGDGQQVVAGAVGTGSDHTGVLCGHDDRVLHLPFVDANGVVGRTSAWVRHLSDRLELSYDSVHAPQADPRVVTYVAMETGEGLRPELGHVSVPAPGAFRTVDVGFDPGMVGLTGIDVDRIGVDQIVPNSVPFDWSYGVAMPTVEGETAEQVLHGSLISDPIPHPPLPGLGAIDPVHAGVSAIPGETSGDAGATDIALAGGDSGPVPASGSTEATPGTGSGPTAGSDAGDAGTARDPDGGSGGSGHGGSAEGGDHAGPEDLPSGRGAAAVVLAMDVDGAIHGRDRVSVSSFTDNGFEVRTADGHSRLDAYRGEHRGVLFYTAWPKPTGGSDPRTVRPEEGSEGRDGT